MVTRSIAFLMLIAFFSECKAGEKVVHKPENTIDKEVITTLPQLKKAYNISLSVYVYQRTLDDYNGKMEELAEAISNFGFTDIYLNFNRNTVNEKSHSGALQLLISSLIAKKINTHAMAFSEANAVGDEQQETLDAFKSYQSSSISSQRFVGIHFDIEPHIMKQSRETWKKVSDKYKLQHIDWKSEAGYGKGGENSQVMRFVFDRMEEIKRKAPGYTYSAALGHFFEDRYADGSLDVGGMSDFLKTNDHVTIMNYTDDKNRLIRQSMQELINSQKPRSVEIAIKTSDNGVGELDTSFADEGWGKMMEALVALCEAAKPYPSFKGIGIFEYQSFEQLWKIRDSPLPSTQRKSR